MNYILSKAAENDLEEIWFYTYRRWSLSQADAYLKTIFSTISFIATNPEAGTDYGFFRLNYFRMKVKSHYIFYKRDSDKNHIEIIRILHERMDVLSRLE